MKKWQRIGGLCLIATSLLAPMQSMAYAQERTDISYISMVNPDNYQNYVDYIDDSTHKSLDEVSPNFFKINADVDETLNDSAIRADFIKKMHERGIRVHPFLRNDWENHITLKNRDALVDKLATDVTTYGLDGINIDLENIDPAYKNNLTDFVRKLRAKLSPDKQVTVAVAPVSSGTPVGWQRTYDYQNLAKALTGPKDYMVIMAYDEHTNAGHAGPVASYPFVENSIKFALSQQVPKEKIVLGIPLFGRLWGSNPSFNPITLPHWQISGDEQNVGIIKAFKLTVTPDKESQTPKIVFTVNPGDSSYKIGNQVLPPDTYTIWYDNEDSIKSKLSLVQKYNLKGAASWSLIQEDSTMWDYYNPWLNAQSFSDLVSGEWDWARISIMGVNVKGWMVGDKKGLFNPGQSLTRAEAASIMVRAMGYENLTPTASMPFTDIKGTWAEKYIRIAKDKGLVSGYPDGTYQPEKPLTREETAQMLKKLLYPDAPLQTSSPFKDVKDSSSWSYKAIVIMNQKRIISGYTDGTFLPAKVITRAEMATLMSKSINRIDELK